MTNFRQQPNLIAAPTIDRLNQQRFIFVGSAVFEAASLHIQHPQHTGALLSYSRSCHRFGDTNSPEFISLLCLATSGSPPPHPTHKNTLRHRRGNKNRKCNG
jgi:hypothetical protein